MSDHNEWFRQGVRDTHVPNLENQVQQSRRVKALTAENSRLRGAIEKAKDILRDDDTDAALVISRAYVALVNAVPVKLAQKPRDMKAP